MLNGIYEILEDDGDSKRRECSYALQETASGKGDFERGTEAWTLQSAAPQKLLFAGHILCPSIYVRNNLYLILRHVATKNSNT